MMKTTAFAVARRIPVRRAVMAVPTRSMSTVRSWVQYWWPAETREFDIDHERIREDYTLAAAAAPVKPVVEMTVEEMRCAAEETLAKQRVVGGDQSWWPHETRDFDVDHDNEAAKLLCEKAKLTVTISK